MSELMVLGFENEAAADAFGLTLATDVRRT